MDGKLENKENISCGCLKLSDKLYAVYKGHNTIGRNPEAVICIKNLNVSKHHAVITVIDDDSHYISDFKSANGTVVNGKKLVPLQLHKLQDGASIKFGDVFTTYKKLHDEKIDKIDDTQHFSENFYSANTQQVTFPNVPDGICFNELPTQVFVQKDQPLNDLPTQVFHYSDDDTSMDLGPPKKDLQTQNENTEEGTSGKSSGDPTPIMSESDSTQILPVAIGSRKILDSEDEEEEPASQIYPVAKNKPKFIESDSSETEEFQYEEDGRSKYEISDDSETDIEKEKENTLTEVNEDLNISVEVAQEEKSLTVEKVKEKVLPDDHIYCQSVKETQDMTQTKDLVGLNEIEANGITEEQKKEVGTELQLDEELHKKDEENESDVANAEPPSELEKGLNSEKVEISNAEKTDPLIGEQMDTTNTEVVGTPNITIEQDEKQKPINENEITEDLDITEDLKEKRNLEDPAKVLSDTSTEVLSEEKKEQNSLSDTEKDIPLETVKNTEDDLFLQPTQTLNFSRHFNEDKNKDVDDDFLQPTQALHQLHGAEVGASFKREILPEEGMSTQNLESVLSDNIDKSLDRLWGETKEDTSSKSDDGFLLPPPNYTSPVLSKSKSIQDDESFIPPTQALEEMHEPEKHFHQVEDQLHDIFESQSILCTQQLVDVLNDSREDHVIDDSLVKQKSFVSSTPFKKREDLSEETVKKMLEDEPEDVWKSLSNSKIELRTYSSRRSLKKNEEQEKTISEVGETSGLSELKDDETVHEIKKALRKRGRPKIQKEENKNQILTTPTEDKATPEEKKEQSQEIVETKENNLPVKRGRKKNEALNNAKSEVSVISVISKSTTSQDSEYQTRRGRSKVNKQEETANEEGPSKEENNEKNIVETVKGSEKDEIIKAEESQITKPRRGRKKQVVDKLTEEIRTTSRTRSLTKEVETNNSTRRTRSNIGESVQNNEEETNVVSINRTTKRKNQDKNKAEEAPSKKKSVESTVSRKRNLRAPSGNNSEDDFISKVPKLDSRTSTRSRQSKAQTVDDSDDIITISSASNASKSAISISSSSTVEAPKRTRKLSANSKRQLKEEAQTSTTNSANGSSSSILSTPDRSKRVQKPKVIFTMMDSPELESLIRQLGGTVVDSVDACTVLVTESVKRTQKLLSAVAQGKPICSPKWLEVCRKSYSFVDPWQHILVDKEAEKKWKFSLRESIERGSRSKLLENYTFQVIVNNAGDVLKGAIEACGGKCVTRNLPKCQTEHLVIVSTQENKQKFTKIVKQNSKIKVVEPEAIFDGTLRQEFHFEKYYVI